MDLTNEKREHFLYRLFCPEEIFFDICVLSQCIFHWTHFYNIHTFIYQKTLLHPFFCLFLKSVERLQCIFNRNSSQGRSEGTSSVAFDVLIINCQIEFINLFIFNCLRSNFCSPKNISFASRREWLLMNARP